MIYCCSLAYDEWNPRNGFFISCLPLCRNHPVRKAKFEARRTNGGAAVHTVHDLPVLLTRLGVLLESHEVVVTWWRLSPERSSAVQRLARVSCERGKGHALRRNQPHLDGAILRSCFQTPGRIDPDFLRRESHRRKPRRGSRWTDRRVSTAPQSGGPPGPASGPPTPVSASRNQSSQLGETHAHALEKICT